ncbi:carboxylate-amine ligase [Ectopseudomonas hydrolytica]|jgi:carboxylate-amine ligase|uniref:carboxylate-amine ligase n=1 Tax=Ectopseudomonas hydrolytica TaxID=2493633 RepID=UPI0010FBF9E8|nr:carboxylate--amine ligase [Pseudomonas mendocina]
MTQSTFGIEEEYFLTDLTSRQVARRNVEAFATACQYELGERVTREMFAAQFEVVTPVLHSLTDARQCLEGARRTLARLAREFDCGVLAAGTHPLGQWRRVRATDMPRYRAIFDDYRMVASRSVLAGLHVHVGVAEGVDRIRLMNRLTPWLPLLLGLSASSPFWNGRPSGLMSYRQAVCDEWPRMGIPDHFADEAEYQRYVQVMTDTGCIRSAANLWWNIRPSLRYPTLELRIADACPRLDDALCLAGLFRAMVEHVQLTPHHAWCDDPLTRVLTLENRWRAKRQGLRGLFIEPASQRLLTFATWLEEVLERIAIQVPASDRWILEHARHLALHGGSAEAQLAEYRGARANGLEHGEALHQVVDSLMAQTELHPSQQLA